MGSFLAVLRESERVPAKMLFLNSGVFLTTEGSPHLEILRRISEAGTEIASCGTCLDYYERKEKLPVGRVGNMSDTVESMLDFNVVRTVLRAWGQRATRGDHRRQREGSVVEAPAGPTGSGALPTSAAA
jgi:hypothetical protein